MIPTNGKCLSATKDLDDSLKHGIGSSRFPLPTTLVTITSPSEADPNSQGVIYSMPTVETSAGNGLPGDPNFPWGSGSPLHRHQNVSMLAEGLGSGSMMRRAAWLSRWTEVVDKMKRVWTKQDEDEASV